MYIIGKRLEKETVKKMKVYIELTTCDAAITLFLMSYYYTKLKLLFNIGFLGGARTHISQSH